MKLKSPPKATCKNRFKLKFNDFCCEMFREGFGSEVMYCL